MSLRSQRKAQMAAGIPESDWQFFSGPTSLKGPAGQAQNKAYDDGMARLSSLLGKTKVAGDGEGNEMDERASWDLGRLVQLSNEELIKIGQSTGDLMGFLAKFPLERLYGGGAYEGSGFGYDVLAQLPANIKAQLPSHVQAAMNQDAPQHQPSPAPNVPNANQNKETVPVQAGAAEAYKANALPGQGFEGLNPQDYNYYFNFGEDEDFASRNLAKQMGMGTEVDTPYTNFLRGQMMPNWLLNRVGTTLQGGQATTSNLAQGTAASLNTGGMPIGRGIFGSLADKIGGGMANMTAEQRALVEDMNPTTSSGLSNTRELFDAATQNMIAPIRGSAAARGRVFGNMYDEHRRQSPQDPKTSFFGFLKGKGY